MHLPEKWQALLSPTVKSKLIDIESRLNNSELAGEQIYPTIADRYRAFKADPCEITVALIGQDPYHSQGQAMGLSFSVPVGVKIPPSLRNIYKELNADCGIELPLHGDLSRWADQGVLLMNTALTVEAGKPGSHKHLKWDLVTSEIVHQLSYQYPNVAFVLWGRHAQGLKPFINPQSFIVESSHPSPIGGSCNKGFFGSRPFSRVNTHLVSVGVKPIDWRIR